MRLFNSVEHYSEQIPTLKLLASALGGLSRR
jgi:hypothetical protein